MISRKIWVIVKFWIFHAVPSVQTLEKCATLISGSNNTDQVKKSSNDSTERFIFLEKAFDKAFQLEDGSCTNIEHEILDQSQNEARKHSANILEKQPKFKSSTVLTNIEPLSLPSVTGSKANFFGSSNNSENLKNQGMDW